MPAFARIACAIGVALLAYVVVGGALHLWVFPEQIPSSLYLRPGDEFADASSGEILRVHAAEDGELWGEFIILPGGSGPPVHVHASTPEER